MSKVALEIGNSNDGNPGFRDVTWACDVTLAWSKSAGLGAKVLDLAEKCWTWVESAGLGWKVLDLAQSAGLGPKPTGLEPEALDLAETSGLAKSGQVQSSPGWT